MKKFNSCFILFFTLVFLLNFELKADLCYTSFEDYKEIKTLSEWKKFRTAYKKESKAHLLKLLDSRDDRKIYAHIQRGDPLAHYGTLHNVLRIYILDGPKFSSQDLEICALGEMKVSFDSKRIITERTLNDAPNTEFKKKFYKLVGDEVVVKE